DLEEFGGGLGLEAESSVDRADLRDVLFEQEILPALHLERHIGAATRQKERHGLLPQASPRNAARTNPSMAPSPSRSTAAKSPLRLMTETGVPSGNTFCTSKFVPGPARRRRPDRALTTRRSLGEGSASSWLNPPKSVVAGLRSSTSRARPQSFDGRCWHRVQRLRALNCLLP